MIIIIIKILLVLMAAVIKLATIGVITSSIERVFDMLEDFVDRRVINV